MNACLAFLSWPIQLECFCMCSFNGTIFKLQQQKKTTVQTYRFNLKKKKCKTILNRMGKVVVYTAVVYTATVFFSSWPLTIMSTNDLMHIMEFVLLKPGVFFFWGEVNWYHLLNQSPTPHCNDPWLQQESWLDVDF